MTNWLQEESTTPLDSIFISIDNLVNDFNVFINFTKLLISTLQRSKNDIVTEREMYAKKMEREAKKAQREAELQQQKVNTFHISKKKY